MGDDGETKDEVYGGASSNFRNFSLIHTREVIIEGEHHPVIQVTLVPFDPETSCSDYLGFRWELVSLSGNELLLQLYFDTPGCISGASTHKDELVITFND